MFLLRWEGGFARGADELLVRVWVLLQMWGRMRSWEANLTGLQGEGLWGG